MFNAANFERIKKICRKYKGSSLIVRHDELKQFCIEWADIYIFFRYLIFEVVDLNRLQKKIVYVFEIVGSSTKHICMFAVSKSEKTLSILNCQDRQIRWLSFRLLFMKTFPPSHLFSNCEQNWEICSISIITADDISA